MKIRGGIIGLDLATLTGYCVGAVGSTSPVIDSVRFSNSYGNGEIGCSCIDWLADMITVHDPGIVIYEAPLTHHAGRQAARIALGLSMAVEIVCYRREVICREAHISTVRKAIVGSGNAKKPDVLANNRAHGFFPPEREHGPDLDASDGCAIWRYGCLNVKHILRGEELR